MEWELLWWAMRLVGAAGVLGLGAAGRRDSDAGSWRPRQSLGLARESLRALAR